MTGRDEFSPAWSPNGKLIAYRRNPPRGDESEHHGRGRERRQAAQPDQQPRRRRLVSGLSSDGRSIAFFSMRAGGRDIWVMRQDGSRKRRLTRDGSLNEYPTWSPNGRTIVFQSTRDGEFELYAMASDGRRQRNLTRHPSEDKWAAWSPDGKWIAFMSMRDGSEDVFVMRPDGTRVRNVTRTPRLQESHPSWSPDAELTYSRHGDSGPIELWSIRVGVGDARRLDTAAEPVFAYDWAPT